MTEMNAGAKATADTQDFVLTRTFNAPTSLVWDAHTKIAHLSKWWGYGNGSLFEILKLEAKPGGIFHYVASLPDGEKMYGKFVFRRIEEPTLLEYVLSFSDENEGVTCHPGTENEKWPLEMLSTITLVEDAGKTAMTLRLHPINVSTEEIETFVAGHDSMTEGYTLTYNQLDEYLGEMATSGS